MTQDTHPLPEAAGRLHVNIQLWLEDGEGEGFGSGRVRLLGLIHELGSLNKAAKLLGMSYRGAWGKIRKAERIFGAQLVEAAESKRDGCRLTPAGLELLTTFQAVYADVQAYALERAKVLLPKA